MTIPTLTWNRTNETPMAGAGARLTGQEFITALATIITASTHWKQVNNWDGVNARGWIEIAPKSATVGIKEGRLLIAVKTADASNVPAIAARLAPWTTSGTMLADCFVGFSPDADSTGPVGEPITSATSADVYPGKTFSGLISVQWSETNATGAGFPNAGQALWIIESAEVLTIAWSVTTNVIHYVTFGRALERPDGNDAYWSMFLTGAVSPVSIGTAPWTTVPASTGHPLADSTTQNSVGVQANHRGFAYLPSVGGGYALYGCGKTDFSANIASIGSYTSSEYAVLKGIALAGGPYFYGASDQLLGFWRQVRWGPAALRSQRLVDGAGVTQALYLHHNASTVGNWGLWFDNFR